MKDVSEDKTSSPDDGRSAAQKSELDVQTLEAMQNLEGIVMQTKEAMSSSLASLSENMDERMQISERTFVMFLHKS